MIRSIFVLMALVVSFTATVPLCAQEEEDLELVFIEERGHFFIEGGYFHNFLWSWENQTAAGGNIKFSRGFGASVAGGYNFYGHFGVRLPAYFGWHSLRTRGTAGAEGQVVNTGAQVQGLYRWFKSPKNRWDPYIGVGAGIDLLTEGTREDNTGGFGVSFTLPIGVKYFFKEDIAVMLEAPIRFIRFFGDKLTAGGTSVLATPPWLALSYKF